MAEIYHTITSVTEVPRFEMTFDNKYLKGTYTIVDLGWYSPYKQYGDNVICMFAYLGFIWYVFKHATSIISGVSSEYSSYIAERDKLK